MLCSFIFPFLYIPQQFQPIAQDKLEPIFQNNTIIQQPIQITNKTDIPVTIQYTVPISETNQTFGFSAKEILLIVYLSGVFISLLLLINNFVSVLRLFSKARKTNINGIRLLVVDDDTPAFSFGRNILISQFDYDTNCETIITHERSHIRLGHFYDLMLMELVKITFWFNPLVYNMIRGLKEIHEFQADDSTLTSGIDATQYQLLIIQKCVGHQKFALANNFNHCQIKKRITMMNKQKTSKAWRWKVATFLPLFALLLVFCGRKGGNEPPNLFKFKDQLFIINRCEIANKSVDNTSKFEVDLFIGQKGNNLNDTTKEKNLIWLSISSKTLSDLTEGEYHLSTKNIIDRSAMTFSGVVWVNNKKMDVTEGELICKRDSDRINITFELKIDKGNKLEGTYSGSFVYLSTLEKTMPQKIPVHEQMPEMKINTNELVIRFKNDGNYINNKLYSRDDFIKEVKAWMKADVKNRGSLIVSGKDFELSDSRNIELTAISNATGMSFVPTLGIDQQAVFLGGGNKAMFEWIKQNIKYPIQDMAYSWSKDVVVKFIVNTKGEAVVAKIVKSLNPEMDAEVLRVISKMPAWKPGMKNGRPVNIERILSIPFE